MIKMLGFRVPADGTPVLLPCSQVAQRPLGELVPPIEVTGRVRSPVARPAATTESGGGTCVARVVLVGDRLPATAAPTEAVGNPRVITNLQAHAATALPVPPVVSLAVAGEAVGGQTVLQ